MRDWSLLDCALDRWRPAIGDPTLVGWLTVAAYAAAALAALVVAARLPAAIPRRRTERLFWFGSAVFLAALAVNKQLDLQSFGTAYGRCIAWAQGWYEARRTVQGAVVLGLNAATAVLGAGLAWRLRRSWRRTGLAAAGLVLVAGFVLVRAVGLHHVDDLIGLRLAGARLNWVLELGGIAVFGAGSLLGLRPDPPRRGRTRRRSR